MVGTRWRAAAAAALLTLVLSGESSARRPAPCPDGTFLADGKALVTGEAAPVTARIAIAAPTIAIAGVCPDPVRVHLVAGRKLTRVSASWRSCPSLAGRVTLKARIAAPACDTLVGTLIAKRARPRRRRAFSAPRAPAPASLVATLKQLDVQARMSNENFPFVIRPAIEAYNPEVVELIAAGPAALDAILPEFAGSAGVVEDTPLTLLAYALERIGDRRAVPVLADWLDRNLFASTIWADEFVTHAIRVLDGQGALNTTTYTYGIDDKLDTIASARPGHAASASPATIHAAATSPLAESRNKCGKTITVTGIASDGRQTSVKIGYTTLFYDLQEQIDLQTDPARRDALIAKQQKFRADDEAFYGNSDYHPIAGADVSLKSNCGGSVTEHLLNAVAAARGLNVSLGSGNAGADDIRNLARQFGSEVSGTAIDPFTVIAHERTSGSSMHVEIPVSVGSGSAVVFSKDNQGRARLHTVSTGSLANAFGPVQQRYNFRPFFTDGQSTPKFYRLDPNRIVGITVDSSACPCDFAFGGVIPVAITEPTGDQTDQRVVTVAGTVGENVTGGTLRVNGSAQSLVVGGGGFSTQAVLSSGDNTLRVAVDGADDRRGCVEKTIRSTTPRTTISATLTWNLGNADVDLYVTQPDGETSWYGHHDTAIGGRLDVDNTSGFGPENYFLSAQEGDTILDGAYTIRVHYYSDHQAGADTPTRAVSWRVTLVVNEGTPDEKRQFYEGELATANAGNDNPGGSGSDWATAHVLTLHGGQPQ